MCCCNTQLTAELTYSGFHAPVANLSSLHIAVFSPQSSALLWYFFIPSLHLNFHLSLLLLPPYSVFHAPFVNLSSLYESCPSQSSHHYLHLLVFLLSVVFSSFRHLPCVFSLLSLLFCCCLLCNVNEAYIYVL